MKHDTAPVSVIVPCYIVSTTLERTLQSIIDQTYLPEQVILIDDGSTDDNKTLELICKFKESYTGSFLKEILDNKFKKTA